MRPLVRSALPTYQTRMRAQVEARPIRMRFGLVSVGLLYAVLVVFAV